MEEKNTIFYLFIFVLKNKKEKGGNKKWLKKDKAYT